LYPLGLLTNFKTTEFYFNGGKMRIAFMGKGGSGKTTLSAAFSRWAANKFSKEVLVFDGDVNVHLQHALGIEGHAVMIGHCGEEIAQYVRGERTDLGDSPVLSTTPPARASRFLGCTAKDPLLSRYALQDKNVSLITVGSFKSTDVGANCYHTKLHSLCMILNHLLDSQEDLVVIDATAGTDSLSTSLLIAYDLNIFVVEPGLKSIRVYLDFIKTDPESARKTFVMLNKVMSKEDRDFVNKHIPSEKIIGEIPFSKVMRRLEQGDSEALTSFISDLDGVFSELYEKLVSIPRDWAGYLSRLRDIHSKNCEWWYNDFYGKELHTGLDESFSYSEISTGRR